MIRRPVPILYLIDLLNAFSGTEKHLYDLVTHIDRSRFSPFVVTFQGTEDCTRAIMRKGTPVRILNIGKVYGRRPLALLGELRQFVRKERITLLQTFHTNPDIYGTVLSRLSGIPAVVSSRRDMGFDWNSRILASYRFLNRYVDRIICVSERIQRLVIENERVPAEKTVVIRNGVEPAYLDRAVDPARERMKAGIPPDVPVAGVLANFNPVKGHFYFLDACRLIRLALPSAHFVLSGAGPLQEELEARVRHLGLGECVHFLGHRRDVPEVLSLMDVLVAPSLSEGFSNTLIEALYLGKAVVATDVGGNPEVVLHGENGLLVPAKDPLAIAKAVLRFLRDPAFAARLGANGRTTVADRFLIGGMLEKTMAVYDDLLQRKTAGPSVAAQPRAVSVT